MWTVNVTPFKLQQYTMKIYIPVIHVSYTAEDNLLKKPLPDTEKTRYVCETRMPPKCHFLRNVIFIFDLDLSR